MATNLFSQHHRTIPGFTQHVPVNDVIHILRRTEKNMSNNRHPLLAMLHHIPIALDVLKMDMVPV